MSDSLGDPAGRVPFVTSSDFEPVAPEPPGIEDAGKEKKKAALPFWLELPLLILAALVIAVVIKTFFFQAFWIPSSSMEDTLQINDRVMVNKLAYRIGDLQRGHVVVFDDPRGEEAPLETIIEAARRNILEAIGLSVPRSEFIKRVIGLPGERVEIVDNQVLIDGVPIDEPYLRIGSVMPDFGPIIVPPDQMFVMGDNRNASQDSRYFGAVPTDTIVGRAFVIMWPIEHWTML
ncbi:MAG: signal peptidase I [Actinomycetota bacterium]|nr:signal peptidase I [Actinomycetota bacterium]